MSETLHLRVLGGAVALTFTHPGCAASARRMFGPMLGEPWSTPDVLVECSSPMLTRSFIRTRIDVDSEFVDAIRVYSAEHPDGINWSRVDPPFPPVNLEPFRNRFVRLHAAAVVAPAGDVLLILGESGLGKTTLSSQLAEEHGYRLLADEDVFLYRRSTVIEPFAMGDGPWLDSSPSTVARSLWGRRPELIATRPAAVSAVLALVPPDHGAREPTRISGRQALQALLAAQRPGGSTHAESVMTLAALTRSSDAFVMQGGRHDALVQATDAASRLLR